MAGQRGAAGPAEAVPATAGSKSGGGERQRRRVKQGEGRPERRREGDRRDRANKPHRRKHDDGEDGRRVRTARKDRDRERSDARKKERDRRLSPEKQVTWDYWTKFGGEGNAFLRECLGGANAEDTAGWEFIDVAEAFARQDLPSIQSLYDSICGLYASGNETDVVVAEMLAIPERVYLVSQLSLGLDKLLDKGSIKRYKPAAGSDLARQMEVGLLGGMVAHSGVPVESPEPAPAPAVSASTPTRKPKPKTWDQIQADVGGKKKSSSACTIL
mmetsp:Transcript_34686/g.90816  ORF Transcript_34686/g.90816 Transcript_34686/m.90816 type:complete len:272 (+) Transcript_34686:239-1054(+)